MQHLGRGDTKIYGLKLIGCDHIRYVGKTIQSLATRLRGHRCGTRKTNELKSQWMRQNAGQVEIVLLETIGPDGDWRAAERKWILHFSDTEHPLLNILSGGEGTNHHLSFSLTHRGKISQSLSSSGVWKHCEVCGKRIYVVKSMKNKRFCSRECQGFASRGVSRRSGIAPLAAIIAASEKAALRKYCRSGKHLWIAENIQLLCNGRKTCRPCASARLAVWRKNRQSRGR